MAPVPTSYVIATITEAAFAARGDGQGEALAAATIVRTDATRVVAFRRAALASAAHIDQFAADPPVLERDFLDHDVGRLGAFAEHFDEGLRRPPDELGLLIAGDSFFGDADENERHVPTSIDETIMRPRRAPRPRR